MSRQLPDGGIELSLADLEALDARWSLSWTPIWENAAPEVLASTHQTWLRDPVNDHCLLDVFREPHDGDSWICPHDETIRFPAATSSW